MRIFKSKLANRIFVSKLIWFLIWLICFFVVAKVFTNADIFLRFAILFWYTILWVIIWVFGIMDKHPILNIPFPFWVRWPILWAMMNFVLVLFMYDKINILIIGSVLEWCSPFWLVLEWIIVWLIIDWFTTKCVWDGVEIIT